MNHRVGYIAGMPGSGKTTLCGAAARLHSLKIVKFADVLSEYAAITRTSAEDVRGVGSDTLSPQDFRSILRVTRHLFGSALTLCDSFPKGEAQARTMNEFAKPRFLVVVIAPLRDCRIRAMQRSPARYTLDKIDSKFSVRRRQTLELVQFCRESDVPTFFLNNSGTVDMLIERGVTLLSRIVSNASEK